MNRRKRIILISLLAALLAGAVLLDPLVRFATDLRVERFEAAEAVYLSRLAGSDRLQQESARELQAYVDRRLKAYCDGKLTYDRITGILSSLSKTGLPQTDIRRAIRSADETEGARTALARAEACLAAGDYAQAIPLYRRALAADEGAPSLLKRAESAYKERLLADAVAAMEAGQPETAEKALLTGQELLGAEDADLADALADARLLKADAANAALLAQAHRLLREEGLQAALGYAEDLRRQAADAYLVTYMEQVVLHEYEEDICSRADAMLAAGDADSALSLLREGLKVVDSQRMKALLIEFMGGKRQPLGELPVLRDDTGDAKTGAESTISRDLFAMDVLSNPYEHSFSVDAGSVSFSLQGAYDAFTGTVAFPYGERTDLYRASATLQVYADGRLVAEFRGIDGASAPNPFSLPMEGVRELTLSWISEGANGWKDWGRFATIFDGALIHAGAAGARGQ